MTAEEEPILQSPESTTPKTFSRRHIIIGLALLTPPALLIWRLNQTQMEPEVKVEYEPESNKDDYLLFIVPADTSLSEIAEIFDIPKNKLVQSNPELEPDITTGQPVHIPAEMGFNFDPRDRQIGLRFYIDWNNLRSQGINGPLNLDGVFWFDTEGQQVTDILPRYPDSPFLQIAREITIQRPAEWSTAESWLDPNEYIPKQTTQEDKNAELWLDKKLFHINQSPDGTVTITKTKNGEIWKQVTPDKGRVEERIAPNGQKEKVLVLFGKKVIGVKIEKQITHDQIPIGHWNTNII